MDVFKTANMMLGGLISEAWGRFGLSYSRSLDVYNMRQQAGAQPSAPLIDVFSTKHQYSIMIIGNLIYLLVTLLLSFYMKQRKVRVFHLSAMFGSLFFIYIVISKFEY